jgi:hypothetical protein
MTDHHARLAPEDAMELGELLTFLHDWLDDADNPALAASLRRFVGADSYDLNELHADLARFAFLLGADDGTRAFDPAETARRSRDEQPRHQRSSACDNPPNLPTSARPN